jgi:hypothetical protein
MTGFNRRTLMKAAGASLLGHTLTGTVSAADLDNTGVPLLETSLSFEFGDVENLDRNLTNRPSKYAINPEQETLDTRTVSDEEMESLMTGDRLVNFQGIKSNVDSIGGTSVNSLVQRDVTNEMRNTYVYTGDGYDMPFIDINWNARTSSELLSSDSVQDVSVEDGFTRLRLASQKVEVRKKIVHDKLVEDDSLPEWKRSKVIKRPTVNVEVDPCLTIAFHPNLDIVATN